MNSKHNVNYEELKNLLLTNNIRPSQHRIEIMKYLIEKKNHPTADTIYKDLVKNMPTLSKTTVYNTLYTLVEKGLISVLNIEDNELRYDHDTSPHIHFKCIKCGRVYDIHSTKYFTKHKEIDGHQIISQQIIYKGICKNCRK